MIGGKKEVEKNDFKDDLERRSTLKASYIIIGLVFFLSAIATTILLKDSIFFPIILIVAGILFFTSGISYYDYGNPANVADQNEKDKGKIESIYKKQEWLNEIDVSLKIAFGIGGMFFLIAIFIFITNSKNYLLSAIFCGCIGITSFTYAFKLKDYKEKIENYEKTLETLEKNMTNRNLILKKKKKEKRKK